VLLSAQKIAGWPTKTLTSTNMTREERVHTNPKDDKIQNLQRDNRTGYPFLDKSRLSESRTDANPAKRTCSRTPEHEQDSDLGMVEDSGLLLGFIIVEMEDLCYFVDDGGHYILRTGGVMSWVLLSWSEAGLVCSLYIFRIGFAMHHPSPERTFCGL
jgi:hypothetical protein